MTFVILLILLVPPADKSVLFFLLSGEIFQNLVVWIGAFDPDINGSCPMCPNFGDLGHHQVKISILILFIYSIHLFVLYLGREVPLRYCFMTSKTSDPSASAVCLMLISKCLRATILN